MPAIHGDKGNIRILENGEVKDLFTINQWEYSEKAQAEERHYAGEQYPALRKQAMGWQGRISLDVVNAELDFLIQRINDAELAGVNVPDTVLALIQEYDQRDLGAGKPPAVTFVFSDLVLIYDSHSGAGKPDLIQKSFSFSASRMRVESL